MTGRNSGFLPVYTCMVRASRRRRETCAKSLIHFSNIDVTYVGSLNFVSQSSGRYQVSAPYEISMSALVPVRYGGLGCSIVQVAEICDLLGQHCTNTAMQFVEHDGE